MFTGLGSKLKSMVYETDQTVATPAAATPAAGMQAMSQLGGQAAGALHASLNVEMVSAIKKITFGRNTAFTQLLSASEALADVIPDQVMRLKAAHKTAGGGRTGKQIADAVDVHLQDVDGEVLRFKSMIDQKTASDVGTMQAQFDQTAAEIAAAQAAIGAAQQQISDLTAAIIAKQQQGVQLTAQIQTATADLKSSQLQFEAAAQAVRNELNGSKAAILSTLV